MIASGCLLLIVLPLIGLAVDGYVADGEGGGMKGRPSLDEQLYRRPLDAAPTVVVL